MPTLILSLGHVAIECGLKSHDVEAANQPYLDWFRCTVRLVDGGFIGVVDWNVMPWELGQLATDLLRIYDAFPKGGALEFRPTEPNVLLKFAIARRGHVDGIYELFDDFINGPSMRGSFVIEQATLPGLAADIRRFVADASSHAA
jgi:hypothetical protein